MKPTLEEKLLHLHKSNGEKSDYVTLIGPNGTAAGWFDLRDEAQKKYLEEEFDRLYRTKDEQDAIWNAQRDKMERERFEKAMKIEAKNWPGGVFLGDDFYSTLDDFYEYCENEEYELPEYIWAAKPISIRLKGALDLWADYMEILDIGNEHYIDPTKESALALDKALEAFYAANPALGSFFEEDHKTAIINLKEGQ